MADAQTDVSFDEACQKFRKFLSDSGCPPNVVWLTPRDVLLSGARLLYIKVPVPVTNLEAARKRYEAGMPRRLGVLLKAFCRTENTAYCFVWTPSDREDSQYHLMPTDLKLSLLTEQSIFSAKEVRYSLHWGWLRFRLRKLQNLRDLVFDG